MYNKNYDYFFTIAETGSLTTAAQKLYTSQPSLTQYLNRLESALGIGLFDRSRSPLTLTKAGEVYLDYLKKSVYLDTSLEKQLNILKNTTLGNIKVGIPLQLQPLVTNKFLLRFINENPGINIEFSGDASPALEKLVARNMLDAAIIHSNMNNPALRYVNLMEERIFLLCNKNHPLAVGRESSAERPIKVTGANLRGNFYLANSTLFLKKKTEDFFEENGISPKNKASLSSISAMLNLILVDESGIALIPESFILPEQMKEVAFLSLGEGPILWHLALVFNKTEESTPSLKAFIEFVQYVYESDVFES